MGKNVKHHSFFGDLLVVVGFAVIIYGLFLPVVLTGMAVLLGFCLIVFSQEIGRRLF